MNPILPKPPGKPKLPITGVLAFCASLLGVVVHFWAGWMDEHKLVLSPVGHLTVLVLYMWLITILLALASLALERRRMGFAGFGLLLAITGIILLGSR